MRRGPESGVGDRNRAQFLVGIRYPKLGIVTANELHVPVSDAASSHTDILEIVSADTHHSFWYLSLRKDRLDSESPKRDLDRPP